MTETNRKFRRKSANIRKEALICATLELISEDGVRGATVRNIAKQAKVSQGLIRHYFQSKDDLIIAAYETHMNTMADQAYQSVSDNNGTAKDRLAAFVTAALTPPIVDPRALALWASFLNKVQNDQRMKATHERTYAYFRNRLESLISATLLEAGIKVSKARLRQLAIACNAIIDGLWLEGGALPDAFTPNELPEIGWHAITVIIGLNINDETDLI